MDPFDTARFAAALQRLLIDADHRHAIADAGRVTVEAFGWPSIAGRYQQIYSSVVKAGGNRADVDVGPAHSHQGESVG